MVAFLKDLRIDLFIPARYITLEHTGTKMHLKQAIWKV